MSLCVCEETCTIEISFAEQARIDALEAQAFDAKTAFEDAGTVPWAPPDISLFEHTVSFVMM